MGMCRDCKYRSTTVCDKHGAIPTNRVETDFGCRDFSQLPDGCTELKRWLGGIDKGSLEENFIINLIDAMEMRSFANIDAAIKWLYELPDTESVRAVRASVYIFNYELPI